jgi:hypothetical protein
MENVLQNFIELIAEETAAGRVTAGFAHSVIAGMRRAEEALPRPFTANRRSTTMDNGIPASLPNQDKSPDNVCVHCEHLDEWHFREGDYTCPSCGGFNENPWNHIPF